MPTGIITPPNLKAAHVALRSQFEELRKTIFSDMGKLVTVTDSDGDLNLYPFLGAFPEFREWVGQRMVHGLTERTYIIPNKDYELTIGLDRNGLDDSKSLNRALIVQGMAESAARLPQRLVIDLLKNGTTKAAYDGQYYFDTDHPVNPDNSALGTQSNYESTGFALTAANFQTARARLRGFKGENGQPWGIGSSGNLVLIIPQALEVAAQQIVQTTIVSNTNNVLYNAASVFIVPELDDAPTAWYLADTSGVLKPFVIQQRQATKLVEKTSNTDDNVFWHKEYIFGSDMRLGAGYGAWQKIFKGVA